ncbi:MAG TPA: hypothetical protein VMT89_06850 [Candidatus Acidoferrales bacterium]|nr:hypothetical protein [Candidatus Acidoferrales bacterium]
MIHWRTFSAVVALLFATAAAAEQLTAGSTLTAFTTTDQNDAPHILDTSVRIILFTVDMDGGGMVKEALAENGREKLAQAAAVYVSDISRMPSFVSKLFALPALRKRDYPIWLDRSGALTRDWPHADGKVTLMDLDGGTIRGIRLLSSSAEVTAALQPAAQQR